MPSPQKILIVDDQPINIKILQRKLKREGIEVSLASNGLECLESARKDPPDLILLDIMMPGMDGIETCQRLKEDPEIGDIPVIFITAKTNKGDKLTGLDAGGVDYITKPIELDETMARIRTQLRLRTAYNENLELQERLAEARRTAAIGSITQGMSHSLNNLLGVVVGYLDLMKMHQNHPEKLEKSFQSMKRAVERMTDLVRQLGDVASREVFLTVTQPLELAVNNAIERFKQEARIEDAGIEVQFNGISGQLPFQTNSEIFESILTRLFFNAREAYPINTPPSDRPIQLLVTSGEEPGEGDPATIRFEVYDQGTGIPEDLFDHIFEPFVSSKTAVGRGLGLPIAKQGASSLNGEVVVESNPSGSGAIATLILPLSTEPKEASDSGISSERSQSAPA